jgi:hypothetical protein
MPFLGFFRFWNWSRLALHKGPPIFNFWGLWNHTGRLEFENDYTPSLLINQ